MVFVGEFVTCVSCRKKTYFVSWERSKVDIVTLRFNKTKGEQVNCCWPKQLNWVDEDAIIKNLRFQKSWGLFFNLYLQTIMFNCFIRSSICWGISIVFTHFNEMWLPKLQCININVNKKCWEYSWLFYNIFYRIAKKNVIINKLSYRIGNIRCFTFPSNVKPPTLLFITFQLWFLCASWFLHLKIRL